MSGLQIKRCGVGPSECGQETAQVSLEVVDFEELANRTVGKLSLEISVVKNEKLSNYCPPPRIHQGNLMSNQSVGEDRILSNRETVSPSQSQTGIWGCNTFIWYCVQTSSCYGVCRSFSSQLTSPISITGDFCSLLSQHASTQSPNQNYVTEWSQIITRDSCKRDSSNHYE